MTNDNDAVIAAAEQILREEVERMKSERAPIGARLRRMLAGEPEPDPVRAAVDHFVAVRDELVAILADVPDAESLGEALRRLPTEARARGEILVDQLVEIHRVHRELVAKGSTA